MKTPQPEDGHRWLHQLVGEWAFEHPAGPDGAVASGTERVRKLGELWVVGESDMRLPGGETGRSVITLGFDPARRRFVGTWVGTMMTTLWVYDGELDPAGRKLSLFAEGPAFDAAGNFTPGTTSRYRDAIELNDDGSRTFTGSTLGPDGQWKTFMTSVYRRTGSGSV